VLKLKHLFFENSIIYKNRVNFPLDKQGAVFIGGRNSEGKSIIFTVLCNILFGSPPLGSKRKAIADKNYLGQVDFEIDNVNYTIQQFFFHSKYGNGYKIFKNGKDLKIAGGIPKCEKFIRNLLPLSNEEYYNFHFLTQDNFHALVYGKPAEQSSFYSAAFSLEIFDEIRKELKEQIREFSDKLAITKEARVKANAFIKELNKIESGKILRKKLQQVDIKLRAADKKLDTLNKEVVDLTKYNSLKKQYKSLEKKMKAIGKVIPFSVIKKERKYLEKRVAEIKAIIIDGKKKIKIVEELKREEKSDFGLKQAKELADSLKKRLANNNLVLKRLKYSKQLDRMQAKIKDDDITNKIKNLVKEKTTTEVNLKRLLGEKVLLTKLKGKTTCPMCFRVIDDPKFVVKQLNNRSKAEAELRNTITNVKNSLGALEEQAEALDRIKILTLKMEELPGGSQINIKFIKNEIDKFERVILLRAKLETFKDVSIESFREAKRKSPEAKETLKKFKKEEEKSRRNRLIKDQLESINIPVGMPEGKLKEVEAERSEVLSKVRSLNLKKGSIEQKLHTVKKLEDEIDKLSPESEKADRYERRLRLSHLLYKAYSPNNLKLDRIHDINSLVVSYLNKLSPMAFDVPIVFSPVKKGGASTINFKFNKGKSNNIRFMSGGYKKRLMLLLIPVISGLVPSSKRSNVIILDEVDANVDSNGISLIGEILIPFLKRKYSSIFVLSPAIRNTANKLDTKMDLSEFNRVLYTESGKIETITKI